MRKLIMIAIASFVWKKIQRRIATPTGPLRR
jgi:hypothetical protein